MSTNLDDARAAYADNTPDPHAHLHQVTDVVADRRGLTAVGAVALALGMGTLGGAFDVITGSGLGSVFAILFIVGCGLATGLVHREDIKATIVMPPLVYVALALGAGAMHTTKGSGSFLKQEVLELATALMLDAPVLVVATLVALLVALGRGLVHASRGHATTKRSAGPAAAPGAARR